MAVLRGLRGFAYRVLGWEDFSVHAGLDGVT